MVNEMTADRRSFLMYSGVAGAAALLAACGGDDDDQAEAVAATTSTTAARAADVALLRTASSLEKLAIAIYKQGLDNGVIKTPANVEMVRVLQAQHGEHAALFDGHTARLGGEPAPDANAPLLQQVQSRLGDEASLLRAALDVAQIAAATYQAAVAGVGDTRLNVVLMSIAGVEARHAALLGMLTGVTLPAAGLSTTERAVR